MRTKNQKWFFILIAFLALALLASVGLTFSAAWLQDRDHAKTEIEFARAVEIRLQDHDDKQNGVKAWNTIYDSSKQLGATPGDTILGSVDISLGGTQAAYLRAKVTATIKSPTDEQPIDLTQTFAPQQINGVNPPSSQSDLAQSKDYCDALDLARPQKSDFGTDSEYANAFNSFEQIARKWNCFLFQDMTNCLNLDQDKWKPQNGWLYYYTPYVGADGLNNSLKLSDSVVLSPYLTSEVQNWEVAISIVVEAIQSAHIESTSHPWHDDVYALGLVEKEFTITFETYDGDPISPITKKSGEALEIPTPTTSEDCYVFVGWYADEEFTTEFTSKVMPSSNITLYALWNRQIFKTNSTGETITELTSYGKTLSEIKIPTSIDDVTITTIGSEAFKADTTLTTIIFAKDSQLASIGASAFSGCNRLTSVVIPKSVKTIESGANRL